MDEAAVVTCFLRNRGEVLLLRRADDAETYPGRWGTVTGYVEDDDPPGTARMEIGEETGIAAEEIALVRAGNPFAVHDDALDRTWRVHPFLFESATRGVTLNEESAGAEWTSPTAILRRETVPELWRSYAAVAPTVESVADDAEHGSAYVSIRALEVLRDAAGAAAAERSPADAGDAGDDHSAVVDVADALLDARPGMAALGNRVNRAMAGANSPDAVEWAAIEGVQRAYGADEAAAGEAAALLDDGAVLTLSRSGTVLDAIREGASAAVVAESRPAREGVGVAEALVDAGLDVTLCTDAAVAHLLAGRDVGVHVREGGDRNGSGAVNVDAVVVGADAVLPDGRVVNKTGTRAAALAADREAVPCYAVAASDKVATDDEPHLESGDPEAVYDGDARIEAVNPTFDVTPADLLAGVVTERGVLDTGDVATVAEEHRELARWRRPGG